MDFDMSKIVSDVLTGTASWVLGSAILAIVGFLRQYSKKIKFNMRLIGMIAILLVIASVQAFRQDSDMKQMNSDIAVKQHDVEGLQRQNANLRDELSADEFIAIGLNLMNQGQYYAAQALVKTALEKYPGNGELEDLQTQIERKISAPITKEYFINLGRVVEWMTDEYDRTVATGAVIIFNADFQPEKDWVLHTNRVRGGTSGDRIVYKGERGTLWIPYGANAFSIN
jgi:hypothetical protein